MAYLEIPLRSDIPAYEFQITLEKVRFTFQFSYNARDARWAMNILDLDGVELLTGIRLITGWPIISRFQDPRLPKGDIFLIDTAGQNRIPELDDLGGRVKMIYRESTTDG